MKVKFLRDYRGKATNERFYVAGATGDFPKKTADYLVSVGAVEVVKSTRKPSKKKAND